MHMVPQFLTFCQFSVKLPDVHFASHPVSSFQLQDKPQTLNIHKKEASFFSLPLICFFIDFVNYYTGRTTVTQKSLPVFVAADMLPPWASVIAFAMERPMPCPPVSEFLDLSVL